MALIFFSLFPCGPCQSRLHLSLKHASTEFCLPWWIRSVPSASCNDKVTCQGKDKVIVRETNRNATVSPQLSAFTKLRGQCPYTSLLAHLSPAPGTIGQCHLCWDCFDLCGTGIWVSAPHSWLLLHEEQLYLHSLSLPPFPYKSASILSDSEGAIARV